MINKILITIAITALTTGCAAVGKPVTEKMSQTIQVEYTRNDWRICRGGDCKKPTKKTVEIYAPAPMVNVSSPPIQPAPFPAAVEQKPAIMTVHFALDMATPTKLGAHELTDALNRALSTQDAIVVTGFTDSTGSLKLNERLATKRALFVTNWLKRHGVKNRFIVESNGRCCYIAGNTSEADMALNRRTELNFKRKEN